MPPLKTAQFIEPGQSIGKAEPEKPAEAKSPNVQIAIDKDSGLYPVKLFKNYRPMGAFKVVEPEMPSMPDSPMRRRDPEPGELPKVKAGSVIELPKDEYQRILKLRLGERADALPV